jgi:hypothetical protein
MALPRLVLALLIGLTIARPLELKIFEKEINTKVAENMHRKILLNDSLLTRENVALMQTTESERNRLMTRKLALEDTLHRLQQAYVQEADGTGGSMQRGIEKLTRMKLDAYNGALRQYGDEMRDLDNNIQKQDSILGTAKGTMQDKRKQYEGSVNTNVGFLERNKALSDLSREESSVMWTAFFISLLIILIEMGPVLSKLIMPVGPYDIALAKEELIQMAGSENEMRKDKDLMFDKMKGIYQKKKELSEELVDKVTSLQRKHMNEELENWEKGESNEKNSRITIEELMQKIRERYSYNDENLL